MDRLNHGKAVVRLNLLRLLKTICDVHPNRTALVEKYGLYEIVETLSKQDAAVLVRELARDILPSLEPVLKPAPIRATGSGDLMPKSAIAPKRRIRRAASETNASLPVIPVANGTPSRLVASSKTRISRQKLGDISWSTDAR